MKNLLLVTTRKNMMISYKNELNKIFKEYINIFTACLEEPQDCSFPHQDIVIVTSSHSFHIARKYITETTKVINLNFSFDKRKIEIVRSLSDGTDVWVNLNYYSTSHQAVFLLQELGLNNVNFYIYRHDAPNITDKEINTALVSECATPLPPHALNVIDLGPKKIAYDTVLDIVVKADILCDEIESKIYQYFENVAVPQNNTSYFYDISSYSKMQLSTITNCIDYSIVIVDNENKIMSFNENFKEMFELKINIAGEKISDIQLPHQLIHTLLSEFQCHNTLIELKNNNKYILVSKEKINKNDQSYNFFIILIKDVTDIFKLENNLRKQISKKGYLAKYNFNDLKGVSETIQNCISTARQISKIDKATLIIGESGTGKELFAQSIHNASSRNLFPFVAVNCAAIPTNLLESELFGYVDGSFTGAKKGGKIGLFEQSHRGTIFLDEIGELPLEIQAKLLRVLEEKEVMKVGASELTSVDTRVIAATNKDLDKLIENDKFRLDLYYRLNTMMLEIPPLRERIEDIPILITEFLKDDGLNNKEISSDVIDFFNNYPWNGNLRELKNCVTYMAHIASDTVKLNHLPSYIKKKGSSSSANIIIKKNSIFDNLNSYDESVICKILELLKLHSLSRFALLDLLKSYDYYISEYKLRQLLHLLSQKEYIILGKGRSGSSITKKGELLISL